MQREQLYLVNSVSVCLIPFCIFFLLKQMAWRLLNQKKTKSKSKPKKTTIHLDIVNSDEMFDGLQDFKSSSIIVDFASKEKFINGHISNAFCLAPCMGNDKIILILKKLLELYHRELSGCKKDIKLVVWCYNTSKEKLQYITNGLKNTLMIGGDIMVKLNPTSDNFFNWYPFFCHTTKNAKLCYNDIDIHKSKCKQSMASKNKYPNIIIRNSNLCLYLTNGTVSMDPYVIHSLGITAVINCTNEREFFPTLQSNNCLRIPIYDDEKENIIKYFETVNKFIDDKSKDKQCNILVHCAAGVSRSGVYFQLISYQLKY